jgi:hypothetical protein
MFSIEDLKGKILISRSKSDLCRKLGISISTRNFSKITKFINENDVDISHFKLGKESKYKELAKACPVCHKEFLVKNGERREKRVCSKGCSNSYFRSGKNGIPYTPGLKRYNSKYRTLCFSVYPVKCALCDFDKIVEVHHIDENHNNNDIDNLIPLCPNHHKMTITLKYKKEIYEQIKEFKEKYQESSK